MKPGIHPDYGPVAFRDVTAESCPFWTGTGRVFDPAGQVEQFHGRYGRRG